MAQFSRLCQFEAYSLFASGGCRFLTKNFHGENISLYESWKYNGLYAFVNSGGADDETFCANLLSYWRRVGENLTLLWIQNINFMDIHAIFANSNRMVSNFWGLNFSGYGAVLRQGTKIEVKTSADDTFTINGRVDFIGGNAVLHGKNAQIDINGKIDFSVEHKDKFDLAKALDSGVKHIFDHEFKNEEEAAANGFVLTSSNHVIQAENAMILQISFNPTLKELHVFLPENQIFPSSFIGISGHSLSLKSLNKAGWTLAETIMHKYDKNFFQTRYYLTLSGEFEPQFNGEDKTVLPGLSGTEYFDFKKASSPKIEFVPGESAYSGEIDKKSQSPNVAWLRYSNDTQYYSQPSDAPLFALDETNGEGLTFLSVPLLTLNGNLTVPQVFYKETGDLPASDLENVIYAKRFEILCEKISMQIDANAEERRAVSPQGLMVGIAFETWRWISLANVGTIADEKLLCLNNVDLPLRKDFADIDMNMIFDNPDKLNTYVEADNPFAFILDDMWTLDMNPACWDNNSLLIIKYGNDSTIRSLVQGNKAFKHALSLTIGDDGNAIDEFKEFLSVIDDEKFTGVIVLGIKLIADDTKMNSALRTVWHGIPEEDRNKMRAHHLIIRHTKIMQEKSSVMQKSAFVDALVYYRADKGISYSDEYTANDYDFKTTAFTLKIKNSMLETLITESELLINVFTSSVCRKEGGNCLIMDGRADSKSGLDGFSFSLRDEGYYAMKSQLEGVKFSRVSLSGDSVFSLDGRLYFAPDEKSDLFSFGFDKNVDCGLGFMSFKISKNAVNNFVASYGDIVLLDSLPRHNSWVHRFPICADMFCYDMSRKLDQCGYINMKTTLAQKKIDSPWYGIRFRVPLGSLGDLSENSILDLYVIAAWSGGESPGLYIGVRLPDALLGGGIDVQGLIKLGFDTISLESKDPEASQDRIDFRLSLKQFTARLLWVSFPPGKNEIIIEADATGKKLGWLGYYRDKEGLSNGD